MKILVLSDSHGNVSKMEKAVIAENPDYIIHLGDLTKDAYALKGLFPSIPFIGVPGNCDYESEKPNELLEEIEGIRFLILHGHTRNVKYGLMSLMMLALEKEARIVLFGHTHEPLIEETESTIFINPGSVGSARPFGHKNTYAVIIIKNDNIIPEIKVVR